MFLGALPVLVLFPRLSEDGGSPFALTEILTRGYALVLSYPPLWTVPTGTTLERHTLCHTPHNAVLPATAVLLAST